MILRSTASLPFLEDEQGNVRSRLCLPSGDGNGNGNGNFFFRFSRRHEALIINLGGL
jgi:hypothetical protein